MISSSQRPLPDNAQHSQQTDIHAPVGFEPRISAGERPQTYALDRAATGTGIFTLYNSKNTVMNINKSLDWLTLNKFWHDLKNNGYSAVARTQVSKLKWYWCVCGRSSCRNVTSHIRSSDSCSSTSALDNVASCPGTKVANICKKCGSWSQSEGKPKLRDMLEIKLYPQKRNGRKRHNTIQITVEIYLVPTVMNTWLFHKMRRIPYYLPSITVARN